MWDNNKAGGDFDMSNCGGGNPGIFSQTATEIIDIACQIKILGALSVGDGRKRPIPSLLPSKNHYLKSYR